MDFGWNLCDWLLLLGDLPQHSVPYRSLHNIYEWPDDSSRQFGHDRLLNMGHDVSVLFLSVHAGMSVSFTYFLDLQNGQNYSGRSHWKR